MQILFRNHFSRRIDHQHRTGIDSKYNKKQLGVYNNKQDEGGVSGWKLTGNKIDTRVEGPSLNSVLADSRPRWLRRFDLIQKFD